MGGLQSRQPYRAVVPRPLWYLSGSPLATSLVAYWRLDEASGNRSDSIGSNTLTDTNTVTSDTGMVYPLSAKFTSSNSEILTIADNTDVSTGDTDWWIACWFKRGSVAGEGLVHKSNDYTLSIASVNQISFDVYGVGNIGTVNATHTDQWSLAIAYHSATSNLVGLSMDGGAFSTSATTGAAGDTGSSFVIGSMTAANYYNGLMGPVMIGKGYIPSGTDASYLYYGGAGRR